MITGYETSDMGHGPAVVEEIQHYSDNASERISY